MNALTEYMKEIQIEIYELKNNKLQKAEQIITSNAKAEPIQKSNTTLEDQEDMVGTFIEYKYEVRDKLGPLFRQLVDPNLLISKFNDVHKELNKMNGKFNIVLFLKLAGNLYAKSTTMREIKAELEATTAALHATGRLTDISTTIRSHLWNAKCIANAGEGNFIESEKYFDRSSKRLILMNLSKNPYYIDMFSKMEFRDILDLLRKEDYSEEAWHYVTEFIIVFEEAQDSKDTRTSDSAAYNANTGKTIVIKDHQELRE